MDREHGNSTENTSLVTVLQAVKKNIFRTLNTLDVYVVKEVDTDSYKCELMTDADITISAIVMQNLNIQVNDAVVVAFMGQDFRACFAQYKDNPVGVRSAAKTKSFHELTYGIIIGRLWPKR